MNSSSDEKRDSRQSAHVGAADQYVAVMESARQVWTAVTDDSTDLEQFVQSAESLTFEMIEAKRTFLGFRDCQE